MTSAPSKVAPTKSVSLPFLAQSWALPVRSTFRFKENKKAFLMKVFIESETTGKNVSAEKAHLLMRKSFHPQEYCIPRQIRSLFSRWSK